MKLSTTGFLEGPETSRRHLHQQLRSRRRVYRRVHQQTGSTLSKLQIFGEKSISGKSQHSPDAMDVSTVSLIYVNESGLKYNFHTIL